MTNRHVCDNAAERGDARVQLYIHIGVYVAVNSLLWFINYRSSPEQWWAIWPTLGWGIGLISHAVGYSLRHGPWSGS
jgi:hypothetical protein